MRPDSADHSFLLDMLHHAKGVMNAVSGFTLEQYASDEDLRMSVERRIEIIGEAASKVSAEFRKQHPDVPWKKIIAQRHILAHEYGEIEDELIWRVATIHIPELVRMLEAMIE